MGCNIIRNCQQEGVVLPCHQSFPGPSSQMAHEISGVSWTQALRLRANPARPINPDVNSHTAAGTGTGEGRTR